jgi:hypothetical protein
MAKDRQTLAVHKPAYYRIRVQGALDESYCDLSGGMRVRVEYELAKHPVTTLTGQLLDQAALMGLLNFLYDRRLPLLLVEYVPEESPESLEE